MVTAQVRREACLVFGAPCKLGRVSTTSHRSRRRRERIVRCQRDGQQSFIGWR
jgi:hypothetical protein